VGRFEQADGGTLFLDEIGELPPDAQAVLLRALQERVIERIGGGPVSVDIRLIAATNRSLQAEVDAGRFRADLFFRLNVYPVTVPPLRQRRSDIPLLAGHFVREFAARHGREVGHIPPHALTVLSAHSWPGNVRELRNVIERAVIASDGPELAFDPGWLVGASVAETARTWAELERQRILDALRAAGGRVYGPGGAAHRLGLNPTTLYGKMRKHGISKSGKTWG
jgi:formate hydrogenlyase transcriptional activator